jgi:hypothetical protein
MTFSNHFLASPRWNFLGWLLPGLAGGFLLYRALDKGLLQFDEADYVTAARRGFVANYLDAGAMPTPEFVAKGVRDVLLGEHSSLSKEMRERDDINFYRHYHAPLTFYLLAIAGNLFGTGEMVFRMVEWLTAVLICIDDRCSTSPIFANAKRARFLHLHRLSGIGVSDQLVCAISSGLLPARFSFGSERYFVAGAKTHRCELSSLRWPRAFPACLLFVVARRDSQKNCRKLYCHCSFIR